MDQNKLLAFCKKFPLAAGGALSLLLLALLVLAQELELGFLALPTHWIAVAALPVVVALVAGGYIKGFKGFGVEIEAALRQPVSSLDLTASQAVADLHGDEKQSYGYLNNLSDEQARAVRWLLFRQGRQGYYSPHAIEQYLQRLPNVEYFEVRSATEDIVGFLPAGAVRDEDGNPNHDALERFVRALEGDELRTAFPGQMTTLRVQGDERLSEVLRKMRSEQSEFAAVLSGEGRYVGVVLARDVERRIADTVLAAEAAN